MQFFTASSVQTYRRERKSHTDFQCAALPPTGHIVLCFYFKFLLYLFSYAGNSKSWYCPFPLHVGHDDPDDDERRLLDVLFLDADDDNDGRLIWIVISNCIPGKAFVIL